MSVPKDKFELENLCRTNVIYHERRERQFSHLIRWTAFISLLLSSVAVVTLTDALLPTALRSAGITVAVAFGFAVTIGNAAALVFDWYGRLTIHAQYKAKWTALLVEAGLVAENDPPKFEALVRQIIALNQGEPPPNVRMLRKASDEADRISGATSSAG